MKFKLDQNLGRRAPQLFYQRGHDVVTVADEQLGSASDETLISTCQRERRSVAAVCACPNEIGDSPLRTARISALIRARAETVAAVGACPDGGRDRRLFLCSA